MRVFFPTVIEKSGFTYVDQSVDCLYGRLDMWLFNGGDFKLAIISTMIAVISVIVSFCA